jgi:hypothetical protein
MATHWLLKDDSKGQRDPTTKERPKTGAGKPRIRCPKCAWEPSRHDVWMCLCLHVWNTFDTGGVCPSCGRQWTETQCQRCHEWSPHQDWYAVDPDESD